MSAMRIHLCHCTTKCTYALVTENVNARLCLQRHSLAGLLNQFEQCFGQFVFATALRSHQQDVIAVKQIVGNSPQQVSMTLLCVHPSTQSNQQNAPQTETLPFGRSESTDEIACECRPAQRFAAEQVFQSPTNGFLVFSVAIAHTVCRKFRANLIDSKRGGANIMASHTPFGNKSYKMLCCTVSRTTAD